jgi:enoyl-CoA hydratase/carnithine racemase
VNSIFNYQTLKVRLDKSTRTLFITLDHDKHENCFGMEMLFELESLLAWCTTKIEIHSIFLQSTTDYFSRGYDKNILKKLKLNQIKKFTQKLQKINQAIMLLPQTIIIDLQMGTENIASELATACDIRIANRSCRINFNHTKLGMIPCSGGIAQLSQIAGHANAKNWLLTGQNIHLNKLEASGFVYESYTMEYRDEKIQELLRSIHEQAPVQRVQTKLGVTENIRPQTETMLNFEKQIAKAAMISEDWKIKEEDEGPMKAKNMKTAVKLSLIKNEADDNLPN